MKKINKGNIKILVLFTVLALAVIGLIVFEVFGIGKKHNSQMTMSESITQTVPAGEAEDMHDSKMEAYRTPGRKRTTTVDEYFGSLVADSEDDISLVSGTPVEKGIAGNSDITGTDAATRVFGTPPSETATPPATSPSKSSGRRVSGMTADEKLEYDRRRAEMVRDMVAGNGTEEASSVVAAEQEQKQLDFSRAAGDGIISSLDDDFDDMAVRYADDAKRPFRCMFVRDEKLKNGQRVTLRLLEEYNVDGIRIPANTHLQAICKIQERLTLNVRSFEMNGRIIPLSLEAYDTDGLVGIYCPDASKASKTASNDAITAAGSTFGGLIGDLANTVLRTGATIARGANGETSVSVNSGYEFYLVKAEKR